MVNTALQHLRKNDVMSLAVNIDDVNESFDAEEPDVEDVERIPNTVFSELAFI